MFCQFKPGGKVCFQEIIVFIMIIKKGQFINPAFLFGIPRQHPMVFDIKHIFKKLIAFLLHAVAIGLCFSIHQKHDISRCTNLPQILDFRFCDLYALNDLSVNLYIGTHSGYITIEVFFYIFGKLLCSACTDTDSVSVFSQLC